MAYIVTVRTQGGMELSGITVNVYADNTHKVLKDCGTTDDFGMVEFTFDKSNKYSITLGDVPAGYNVSNAYSFNGTNADITLSSSVIKGEMPYSLKEGDVMYDITVEAPDGSTYTISEILKNKDAVMLNFWFATCSWCIKEFPYINEAYAQYKDDIEILAVNPFDSMSDIAYVKNNYGLTFPMVSCDYSLSSTFGVTGYPTTIIIDKYGVIRMVESGARTYLDYWTWLFDQYTN
jgi:peroxiredoxin